MKNRAMTMRQRMTALAKGKELDRVPFVQGDGVAAPNEEVWDVIGRENLGILRWSSLHRMVHPHCHFEREDMMQDGLRGQRRTLHTPSGTLTAETLFDPVLNSGATRKHFIAEPEDYRVLLAYLRDVAVLPDVDCYLADDRRVSDDGIAFAIAPRTPYQQLWVEWVSMEDLSWHLLDYPDLLADVIAEMIRIQRQIFETIRAHSRQTPLALVNIPDNITAPMIGERNFRQYCLPLYQEFSGMLAEVDVGVIVHMDGDLKPLWSAIGESGLTGLDSLSPPPDNDTSAGKAHELWPDMRLLLNFPSSVHLAEPARIAECAWQILQEAGHSGRLQIQISENMPPGAWRKSLPVIARAIAEFGKP